MNQNSTIVNQQAFLAQQLTKMQAEMDQLANDDTPAPKVVPIQPNQQPEVPTLDESVGYDAVLVTGTFEFRPNTQVKERLTLPAIDKAMAELENALSLLGVTLDYERIRAVALNTGETQLVGMTA